MQDQVVTVEAVNPETIACPPSLLACALQTAGVREHPTFRFTDTTEEVNGQPVRRWCWHFEPRSADGLYETNQLIKWWHDPAWLDSHRTHEFAVIATALQNFQEHARRVRLTVPAAIVRRGTLEARIPADASPERQRWLLDQVEGRIPFGTPFQPQAA